MSDREQHPIEPVLSDAIVNYLRRSPARLSSVASHFGITPSAAHWVLFSLAEDGKVKLGRYLMWEVASD